MGCVVIPCEHYQVLEIHVTYWAHPKSKAQCHWCICFVYYSLIGFHGSRFTIVCILSEDNKHKALCRLLILSMSSEFDLDLFFFSPLIWHSQPEL